MLFSRFAGRCRLNSVAGLLAAAFMCMSIGRVAIAQAAALPAGAPVVKTTSGSVSGRTLENMWAYGGIPYAAPPVGVLRWQPPQPVTPWSGVRAATSFGHHCPQSAGFFGKGSLTEDCLYLNVFVPAGAKAGSKLPVMVWIHGGAFISGESDDYNPDRLISQNVIVVTLNYRLGYLGFLSTSGLDGEKKLHSNYGSLDQRAALAWTHANIAAFGGDPARTTVFGQSAGGASTFTQILSPLSAGLFSRAIVHSGAYSILTLPSLAAAETQGNALAAGLGCAPTDTACLRKISVGKILALQTGALTGGPSPVVDGVMLPVAAPKALALGLFNHVPIVQGTDHDEFRLFTALGFDLAGAPLTAAEYPLAVQAILTSAGLGGDLNAVLAQYPLANYASPDLAYSALTTDAAFCTPAFVTDDLLSAYVPVYAYEFADENAPEDFLPPVSFPYAAAHGSELQYLYDSFDRPRASHTSDQAALAAAMVGYWTRFAASATPNDPRLPLWSPFAATADDMISLVPPRPHLFESFVPDHKVVFWARLASASGGAQRNYVTLEAAQAAARVLRPNVKRELR